jgi:hypothetical protein
LGGGKANIVSANSNSITVNVPFSATYNPITVINKTTGLQAVSTKSFLTAANKGEQKAFTNRSFVRNGSLGFFGLGYALMKLVDIDGDGKLDAGGIDRYGNEVHIYKNVSTQGKLTSKSFTEAIHFAVHSYILYELIDVEFADLNGDAALDMVITYNSFKSVAIYINQTPGQLNAQTFSAVTTYNIPSLKTITVSDLNLDGKVDILACTNDKAVLLKNNTGTGSKTPSFSQQQLGALPYTSYVNAKDMDGDGKTDVVASTSLGLYVLRNTTTSAGADFTYQETVVKSIGGSINYATDIDADGKNDIVVLNTGSTLISVYKNTSLVAGNISFAASVLINTTYPLRSLAVADVTGDGYADIVAGTANSLIIASNKGTGSVDFNENVVFENQDNRDVLLGDLDNDGKNDIINIGFDGSLMKNNIIGAPEIAAFMPKSTWYRVPITVTGKNLGTAYKVSLGGVEVGLSYIQIVDADKIIVSMPHDAKSGDLIVYTADGVASASGFIFTEPPLPKIISVTPSTAAWTETVTITGEHFYEISSVTLGGERAYPFTRVSDNTITAVVGEGATGDVTVTGIYGTGSISGFVHKSVPRILGINTNVVQKGSVISLTGKSFIGATRVTVGGMDVESFKVESNTKITAVVGMGDAGYVIVYNQFGPSSGYAMKFDGPKPIITDFYPKKGPAESMVKITGANFSLIPENNHVYFGPARGVVTAVTSTEISVKVPNGATYAPINITVNGKTTTTTLPFTLTYAIAGELRAATFGSKRLFSAGSNIALADFDSNGLIDFVLPSTGKDNANIYYNKSTINNFVLDYKALNENSNYSRPFHVAVSSDASREIYTLNREPPGYIYLVKIDQSNYSFSSKVMSKVSQSATAISVGDMDGDGTAEPFVMGEGLTFPNAKLVDIDGDGKTDVVTLKPSLQQISVYRNTSVPGSVSYATAVNISVDAGLAAVTAIDVDEDGKVDLAVTCGGTSPQTTGSVIILKNASSIGNVLLSKAYTISGISNVNSITAGDLNGDGRADLLAASGDSKSVGYKNTTNGTISFSEGVTFDLPGNYGLTIVDMDGDGKPDLCGFAQWEFYILRNTSGQTSITSFSPATATAGNEVIINGEKFSNTTSVSFDSAEARSFTIVSDTQIKAIVNERTEIKPPLGLARVNGTNGNAFYYGFNYVDKPGISPDGPLVFNKGGSVELRASTSANITNFEWYRNDQPLADGKIRNYTATQTGKYVYYITINGTRLESDPAYVKVQYLLPQNNFKISVLSATCKGANNGAITVTAEKELDYTVAIKSSDTPESSFKFVKSKAITSLKAGLYTVKFTIANEPDFEQEFSIKVNEPKDLIVYQSVDPVMNTVTLNFEGGDNYNVRLNGSVYSTTSSQLKLALANGTNELIVTTDKDCQGEVKKLIKVHGAPVYPIPFVDWVNVDLGDEHSESVPVELSNMYGKVILTTILNNQNGKARLNLSSVSSGAYLLKVRNKVYKVWKQ